MPAVFDEVLIRKGEEHTSSVMLFVLHRSVFRRKIINRSTNCWCVAKERNCESPQLLWV